MEPYSNYIQIIDNNLNLQPNDWYFKSNSVYNEILEHVDFNYGNEYLNYIIKEFKDIFYNNLNYFIDLANTNDLYGKTIKYNYNNFCNCSPSNLRYICHSLLIWSHIKNINNNNIDIVEIGGGYGGLCFYIKKLCHLFNINIKSYNIFDLKSVSILQQKYLNILNINDVTTSSLNDDFILNPNSFLISNYGFSEFSKSVQNEYIDKVISKYISNGFLTWNFIPIYKFIDKEFKIEAEQPSTSPNNFYIYF